ncbi:MAG: hypothetical protein WC958_04505 [Dehalococcoidales bacterium]
MDNIAKIQDRLIKASERWALGKGFDLQDAAKLRLKAILLNHRHYYDNIPLYRQIAAEEGCGKNCDFKDIKEKMMLSTDIFKSYRQSWIDNNDYKQMNNWVSSVFHRKIDIDTKGIQTIDEWINALDQAGIYITYSSGTSGAFSFVPREKADWELSRRANITYLTPLLTKLITDNGLSNPLIKAASVLRLSEAAKRKFLLNYDAAFLAFESGRMGNQALIEELAPLFKKSYFLYTGKISGSALRQLQREPNTEKEREALESLKDKVTGKSKENYLKLAGNIEKSTQNGQKLFLFGAPYQFKELCEVLADNNRQLSLHPQSVAMLGGGWKAFTGNVIDRNTLIGIIKKALGIDSAMISEGYSMTESSILTIRCREGSFHIPPTIEPLVFDAALKPLEGNDVRGAFGFMDTLATSHPGFLISNDYVHMVNSECPCGLNGPAILEIGRLAGSEVKGCGGIMGSFSA